MSDSDIIRLSLSAEQAQQLAPLVHRAASQGENMLFLSVAVPYRSRQEEIVWSLEVVLIPARLGAKIKKLIEGGAK
jgi:hypothetical protein